MTRALSFMPTARRYTRAAMASDRVGYVSVREAADYLGIPRKAMEQAVFRGSIPSEKDNATGRRWIKQEDLEDYAERKERRGGTRPRPRPAPAVYPSLEPDPVAVGGDYWRELAEAQAVEIVRLKARIAQLEAERA
jgi:excisionase family DNA binding protein